MQQLFELLGVLLFDANRLGKANVRPRLLAMRKLHRPFEMQAGATGRIARGTLPDHLVADEKSMYGAVAPALIKFKSAINQRLQLRDFSDESGIILPQGNRCTPGCSGPVQLRNVRYLRPLDSFRRIGCKRISA